MDELKEHLATSIELDEASVVEAPMRLARQFRDSLSTLLNETDLQRYLEEHPHFLLSTVHRCLPILITKLPLGADFVPDFAFYSPDYNYLTLHLVELESPCLEIFTASDGFSAPFTHALQQIEDWGRWCRANYSQLDRFHRLLPLSQINYESKPFDPLCVILHLYAGRRSQFTNERRLSRWRERFHNLPRTVFVHTCDGMAALMDACGPLQHDRYWTFRYAQEQFISVTSSIPTTPD